MLGFAALSEVALGELPSSGQAATALGPISSFGTPNAAYARTQTATGAAPSTTFGTAKVGTTVAATSIAPNTKLGAPPKFGPIVTTLYGNGADGSTTFLDDSPYYRAVTRNGSIAVSAAQSRFGTGSISLTGASTANNLALASDKLFNLTGRPFEIEAEVYINAYNASGGRLLSSGGGANGWNITNGYHWLLQTTATGVSFSWLWYGYEGGYWGHYTKTLSATLALSTWAQVKVTFDGTTVRLFLDNTLIDSLAKPPTTYGWSPTSAQDFRVGALTGEATGATNAANAYIQHIRLRRECLTTASSSAPTAGLGSWIGELAGIAPTTQVPAPGSGCVQPASGFTSIQFGTGFGQNLQRPTGFQTGAVGDPRIFPYSPPPINSTQFGTGRLFPYHVAPGINGTHFGTLAGRQHWDVEWAPPKTRFGTPFITFNQTRIASGFASGNFGTPLGMRVLPPNTGRICIAGGFYPVRIGSPSATWPRYGAASGIAAGHLGVPNGVRGQRASGINSTAVGVPAVKTMHKASGFASGQLGLAVEVMTQRAAGSQFVQRFGLPESDRGHSFKVYGINASGRIGSPTGFSRFNYRVTGFRPSAIGSATCHESHRVIHIMPMCRIGNPILKRNTQC